MNALGASARADVVGAVQVVFIVGGAIAALAMLATLLLPEVPLRTATGAQADRRESALAPLNAKRST